MNIGGRPAGAATPPWGRRIAAVAALIGAALLALLLLCAPAPALAASTDLAITKTADNTSYAPGDQITYTLRVDNNGPDPSGATATDVLPPGVTFVSSGPGCSYAPGPRTVTCNYSSIGPGGFATQSFIVSVDIGYLGPPAPPNLTPHDHQLITDKVEAAVDLNPGETRHETLSCPGYLPIMTDGTVLVQHVDQGTGTIADVQVVEARPTISGTGEYEFTIINHATGHAQVKLFGVCLSNTTNTVLGHAHSIQFTPSSGLPLFGNTNFGTGGYHEARSVPCPIGTQPTSPGFKFLSSNGRVVKSEQYLTPAGEPYWVFGFVLDYPATVQVSIRCMKTALGSPGGAGHTHDLQLKEIFRNVSVAPGTSVHRLDCGTYTSDAKGITATYDFDSRLRLAGTTPQPIIRDFTFFNPTAGPLGAHIDLICLRMHTGPAHSIRAPLTNRASVLGPNPDPNSGNDTELGHGHGRRRRPPGVRGFPGAGAGREALNR